MTDDLTARLERALHVQEQQENGLHPDAAALADLHARVARGRRARATSHAAVAAVAAGVIGVAGWFGLQDRPAPEPAHTPTPSVPSTPSPSPEPTAAASEPAAAPLEPVTRPGMPAMFRAPEGLLERTGPGWFLLAYGSPRSERIPGRFETQPLVLSSPTGELYHLSDGVPDHEVVLVRWDTPGTARVEANPLDGDAVRIGTVDLLTGSITFDDRLPETARWVGMSGEDEVWYTPAWTESGTGVLHVLPPDGPSRDVPTRFARAVLSPDGRTVAGNATWAPEPEVVDVATGRLTKLRLPAGQHCRVVAWLDATGVMASCVDREPDDLAGRWNHDEHGGQVVRLDAAGGEFRTLTTLRADGVVPGFGGHVRDGVVVADVEPVLSSTDPDCYGLCTWGAYLWTGGDAQPVTSTPAVDDVCGAGVASGGLLLYAGPCYEEPSDRVWLVDEATGTAREIAPTVGGEDGYIARSVIERS